MSMPTPDEPDTASTLDRACLMNVSWQKTDDVYRPLRARVDGQDWVLRLGEFPVEPLYTLEIGGVEVGSFDGWPEAWQRDA